MRLNRRFNTRANVLIINVLARPGTPSSMQWPRLKSEISSEYVSALSGYVSNLNELKVAKNNITVAKEIFNTVKYQYDKGIKAYLEVIVSETDLRTAELNYLNILFQVLTSKMDLEKALGDIKLN